MNKKQKVIAGVALAIFALTLLAAPWTVTPPPQDQSDFNLRTGDTRHYTTQSASYSDTAPVWDGPFNGQLNVGTLLIEWVAIGVISGGLFVMLRQKH